MMNILIIKKCKSSLFKITTCPLAKVPEAIASNSLAPPPEGNNSDKFVTS